ncbi:hypothetical protein OC834_000841 [Tilletia horrida]|nr:hypothetical protein OC834_000841 [Tilletia horrida]
MPRVVVMWVAAWASALAAVLYAVLQRSTSPQLPTFPPADGASLPSRYAVCQPPSSSGGRRIHTLSRTGGDALGSVRCLLVDDGRVIAHPDFEQLSTLCPSQTQCQVYRLPSKAAILPGLHDAHGHVLDLGWSRTAADLVGSTSVAEVIARLEAYVQASELHREDASKWVEGLGWDQSKFDPPIFPTAADLDASEVLRNRSIALRRVDVHALWLSSRALEKVVQLPTFPAPGQHVEGGLVIRDPNTKQPTGILVDNAMNFAYEAMPRVTDAQRRVQLEAAAESILSVGLTNVGDAAVDADSIAFLQRAADHGKLPFRLYAFLACGPGDSRCRPPQKLIRHAGRLTVRTVKLFADGALGSWGSAMLEPYDDHKDERGLLLIPEEDVEPLIRTWVERGWQVATHAIGDRANKLVLDAYESIVKDAKHTGQDLRLRVEHAQIMRRADIPRFAELGVVASMQPTHCTSDMGYVETRIGHERAKGAYAWKSLLDANGALAFGSDFPVELANPFHGIYSAITRLDAKGNSPSGPGGWFPAEKLSRLEALEAFTVNAAYAQFEEALGGGTLGLNTVADFVVVDRDIMDEQSVSPAQLRGTKVLATVIDGRIVWKGK